MNIADIVKIYGDPGLGRADSAGEDPLWRKANLRSFKDMPGLDPTKWFNCHKLVEPHFRKAFALVKGGDYKITKAGCFSFRHMRHDVTAPLSRHSWAIAVDINSGDNGARYFKRGEAPVAWSAEWKKIWPRGVTPAFVEAWRSCGFLWGGDWDRDGRTDDEVYVDPMHFEFTLLKP
jgi:hypothetical protein